MSLGDQAIGARIALEGRLLAEARRNVRKIGGERATSAAAVSREYDRLRSRRGLPALVANRPPPGWTVEQDRREELLAMSEHPALRRVA